MRKKKSLKDSSSICYASYHQKELIDIVLLPMHKTGQRCRKRPRAP
jgi:hypothetical protein